MPPPLVLVQGPPSPIVELIGAYPRGEVLCARTTADGTRTFVADGATLTVLDTATLIPELYQDSVVNRIVGQIELSDVPSSPTLPLGDYNADPTANQMVFHRGSQDVGSLFIAGGTGGMFRVDLSRGWFENGFPKSHTTTVLETPYTSKGQLGDAAHCRWKRCVDVAFVDQGARKIVLGLFAASQRHGGTMPFGGVELGASEVVAWEFTGTGPATFYGRYAFSSITAPPVPPVPPAVVKDNIIATAIAADPGDPNHVYVALGIRWLWRLDISGVDSNGFFLGAAELSLNPSPVECNGTACPEGERMRDLDIVRRAVPGGTQGLAYAVLEYGKLLEIELPATSQTTASVLTTYSSNCGYGERVTAVTDAAGTVLVALGLHEHNSWYSDTAAPYRPTGIWRDPCVIVGLGDPNAPGDPFQPSCGAEATRVRVFRRLPPNTQLPGSPPITLNEIDLVDVDGKVDGNGIFSDDAWGSLQLRYVGANRYLLYDANSASGLTVWQLQSSGPPSGGFAPMAGGFTPTPAPRYATEVAHYAGPALGAGDGEALVGDDTLAFFGGETLGPYPSEGLMLRVTQTGSIWDLVPIPKTISACASRTSPLEGTPCANLPNPYADQKLGDPSPFRGGVLGSANWIDPWDGAGPDHVDHAFRLWLVPAAATWRLGGSDGCATPGDPACFPNPCSATQPPWRLSWLPSFDGNPDLANQTRSGFQFTLVDPLQFAGDSMDMRWWQVASPTREPDDRNPATDLLSSSNDPRLDVVGVNQALVPKLIHCVRNGSEYGYKIMSPYAFMQRAKDVCPGPNDDDAGRGQELLSGPAPAPGSEPAYYEMRTHVELEHELGDTGPEICVKRIASTTCQFVPGGLRSIYNTRSDTFALQTTSFGLRYVTAVASGFVATADLPGQLAGCSWTADAGKAMVVFYDVTNVPGNAIGLSASPPQLLRVAVGPDVSVAGASHAFAVRAKTYSDGKTFVFLGDLLGRVFIIDVSGDVLFPAAPVPYRSPNCSPNCTPILSVLLGDNNRFAFAADVVDGRRPNLLDLEIDGDELYCAFGRAGIAILDISRNLGTFNLIPIACLDTPGMAQGLAMRGAGSGRQLLVGDSRSGMRLYGRFQEE